MIAKRTVTSVAKLLLLAVSALSLNGCFFISARVSESGLREYVGNSKGLETQSVKLALHDVETKDGQNHPTKVTYHPRWPYVNHGRGEVMLREMTGTVIGGSAKPYEEPRERFIDSDHTPFLALGTVTVEVEGKALTFEYGGHGDPATIQSAFKATDAPVYRLQTRTCEWYRYPSQVVLPVTMAVDLGLDVLMLPLWIIAKIALG